jgi:hypothetical protein
MRAVRGYPMHCPRCGRRLKFIGFLPESEFLELLALKENEN